LFESGSIIGDNGLVVRGELSRALTAVEMPTPHQLVVTPYLFGAVGRAWLLQPTAVELGVTDAANYGVGVRVRVLDPATASITNLSVEAGRQISNRRLQPDATKVMFTLSTTL
jgi:hemolysin activation/secretion protein